MKTRHIAVNILTGFFAALLSILLVVLVFATALYSSVTALLTPQNISALAQTAVDEVVAQLNPENLVQDNEELAQIIEGSGVPAEVVAALLESEAVDQIIDLYARDVAGLLAGEEVTGSVTPEVLKEIVNNNIDEIVRIAADVTGDDIDTEKLKAQITDIIDREAEKLVQALPSVEVLTESLMESDIADTVEIATKPTILWTAILICLVLAGLIYALRCYRFGGFMWIGVCAALAGILLATVCVAIRNPLITALLGEIAAEMMPVADALVSVFAGRLALRLVVVAVLAALFITGYILLYYLVIKKKKEAALATDAPADETSAEPALPETAE